MEKTNEVELNIGTLSIYNNVIAVIEIKNTDVIKKEDVMLVISTSKKVIGKDFALISNRTHNYTIDPIELYSALMSESKLKCAAVVCYRPITEKLYSIEHEISNEISNNQFPLESFSSLEDAVNWSLDFLKH